MFKTKPDISHLKVFECRAYIFVEPGKRKKLDDKARLGIFLGYENNCNAYTIAVPDDVGQMKVFSRGVLHLTKTTGTTT